MAFDGSSRHPCFVVPPIHDGLAVGTPVEGLALVEAAWALMCEGEREILTIIEPNDPLWNELQAKAREAHKTLSVWLEMRQFYGDLADEPRFADSFFWLEMIWSKGLEKTIST